MKKAFQRYILVFAVSMLMLPLFAQEEYFDSLMVEKVKLENPIYKPVIGIGGGAFNFYGDVNNNYRNAFTASPAGKIVISSFIDKAHTLMYDIFVMFGRVTGNESTVNRNLNFSSRVFSLGVNVHYEFAHFIGDRQFEASPFVEIGLGTLQFSPKGDLLDGSGNPYVYAPDGTLRDINDLLISRDYEYETDLRSEDLYGAGNYSQFGVIIPLGIGLNADLSNRVKMRIGTSFNISTTDYLDNVSHKDGLKLENRRPDFFNFSYISMHFDLFSQPEYETVEHVYLDYEADELLMADEDLDWVLDFGDECPFTPNGVEVDSLGCPLDGDDDMVPDYLDKEMDTPAGAWVDENGIEMTEEELIAMLDMGTGVPREDLEYYLQIMREGDEEILSRPHGVPLKFKAFDMDGDDNLSFDEFLYGIQKYFDYRTFLSLQDIYEMMEFYFIQE